VGVKWLPPGEVGCIRAMMRRGLFEEALISVVLQISNKDPVLLRPVTLTDKKVSLSRAQAVRKHGNRLFPFLRTQGNRGVLSRIRYQGVWSFNGHWKIVSPNEVELIEQTKNRLVGPIYEELPWKRNRDNYRLLIRRKAVGFRSRSVYGQNNIQLANGSLDESLSRKQVGCSSASRNAGLRKVSQ